MAAKTYAESPRARDAIEFRLLIAATFVLFLVGAVVSRLLPWHWRIGRGAAVRPLSIIGEAKAKANALVPFVFMG